MQFIKRIARSAYEKVIVDEFLEPITTEDINVILQRYNSARKRSVGGATTNHQQPQQVIIKDDSKVRNLLEKQYDLPSVFAQLSKQPKLQEIQHLIRELKDNQDTVKEYICENHLSYITKITQSLEEADNMVQQAQSTKPKLVSLRQKLKKLQESRSQSEKVVALRIKAGNIKNALSVLAQMPNLTQMSVSELKSIVVPQKIKELKCYTELDAFIKLKIEQEHQRILSDLREILTVFDGQKYKKLLMRYSELGGGVELDKLILGVSRQIIRQFDVDHYELCEQYVKYMVNYHLVCRWYHQQQSNTPELQSLKHSIFEMRKGLWGLMQDQVQILLSEMIGLNSQKMLEITCQLNRFVQIGENFSGVHIGKIGEELFLKSISMGNTTLENGLTTTAESLSMEESLEWSRLPVENHYRSQTIENCILGLAKLSQLPLYKEFIRNNLCFLDPMEKKVHNPDEDWSFKKFVLASPSDTFRLKRLSTNVIPCSVGDEVVICQSVLPVLKFYQNCSRDLFHLRLVPQRILNGLYLVTQYYVYYLFSTFLPPQLKNLIINPSNALQQRYQRCKLQKKYPTLIPFIKQFKTDFGSNSGQLPPIKQSKQEKKMLRSRVVSVETFRYLVAYLEFCLGNLKEIVRGVDRNWDKITNKIAKYRKLHQELGELLYSECVTKVASPEAILNLRLKIRWEEEVDLEPLRLDLESFMKQFHKKLKGLSKGQIPSKIIDHIFLLFCKFVIQTFCEVYLRIRKINSNGRTLLKQVLLKLQKQMAMFSNGTETNFTKNFIDLIEATNSQTWEPLQAFLKRSTNQFQLSFKQINQVIGVSRYSDSASRAEIHKKEIQVQQMLKASDSL